MNWGLRILFLYVGFVAMIITLVVMSTYQKHELVRTDYYAEELRHQQKLDKQSNADKLSALPQVTRNGNDFTVQFPKEQTGKSLSGTINFYRPSDQKLDRKFTVQADSQGVQLVKGDFKSGLYHVQLDWTCEGQAYFSESTVVIP